MRALKTLVSVIAVIIIMPFVIPFAVYELARETWDNNEWFWESGGDAIKIIVGVCALILSSILIYIYVTTSCDFVSNC